ncbi:MAG: fibronectin type III domain-containing protein, partial [Bacteroidota bacterium]|nr:fibronectin type III domain-containing protein [Bacteroidota bacterium]
MKKLFIPLFLSVLFATGLSAQSIANYAFTTSTTSTLESMSSGTTQLIGASSTDVASALTNIGFTFYYMGTPYTQFSVNSNGQLRLGSTVISNTGITNAVLNAPLIVPMSAENLISGIGKVHYKVFGSAPSRYLTVEWRNLDVPNPNYRHNLCTIQVILYETSGIIKFRYANTDYNHASSTSKATFISSSNTATTVKYIGTDLASAINGYPIVTYPWSNTNAYLLYSRLYTFTPPGVPMAPTWKATPMTIVSANGMTLNWNDNSTNETGFQVYRSDDGGATYSNVATLPANSSNYAATGLQPPLSYHWKIVAVNEGSTSTTSDLIQPIAPTVA